MKKKSGFKRNRDKEIHNLFEQKKRKLSDDKFPENSLADKYSNPHTPFSESELNTLDESEFLTKIPFSKLKLASQFQTSIVSTGYSYLTQVQAKVLPHAFNGKDIFCESPTGSGKTLSFIIPVIDRLLHCNYVTNHGVCGIILVPIRELALQIYNESKRLIDGMGEDIKKQINSFCVIGGGNKTKEGVQLSNGVNLLIGTPGRMLDHLCNTEFNRKNLRVLVLDEADRMLDQGFEMDIKSILYKLKNLKNLQCLLFSATNSHLVKGIANKYLGKRNYEVVKISERVDGVTFVKNLTQGYVSIPTKDKFMLLLTFIRKNRQKKVIVFFATCKSVTYFSKLLKELKIKSHLIHGELSQRKRTNSFNTFKSDRAGILLCTNVCARGIDIKNIHWIIQYDPPNDLRDYVHRVGRTAREGKKGNAVLFLSNKEDELLREFEKLNIKMIKYKIGNQIINVQAHLEEIVQENYHILQLGYKAFQTKCYSYKSYPFKDIFNMKNIDLEGLATQMGLKNVPYISLEDRK